MISRDEIRTDHPTRTDTVLQKTDQNSLPRFQSSAMDALTTKCFAPNDNLPVRSQNDPPSRRHVSRPTSRWPIPWKSKFGPTSFVPEIAYHPFDRSARITG